MKLGITSLDQLSEKKKPPKKELADRKVSVKVPIKPKRFIHYPVPVYHYVPHYRHSVAHYIHENHRHYFY